MLKTKKLEYKAKWMRPYEAYHLYDIAQNSVQARLCKGYNMEHYYKKRKAGTRESLIDVGYLVYIRELRLAALEACHELYYKLADIDMIYEKLEALSGASYHSWYVWLNRNMFKPTEDYGLGHLRISRKLEETLKYGVEVLKNEGLADNCSYYIDLYNRVKFERKRLGHVDTNKNKGGRPATSA